jgi:hypothetical protein
MRRLRILLAFGVAIATSAAVAEPEAGEAALAKALVGRMPVGAPRPCLYILYHDGSRIWVNRPRSGAGQLRDQILVTRSDARRLCRTDSVDLIARFSQLNDGFVLLGDFVPYDRPKRFRKTKTAARDQTAVSCFSDYAETP